MKWINDLRKAIKAREFDRHGQSPDVRRAISQAKRFKSKGSSPRTSTVDSNRYGGVKVRVTLTVLVRIRLHAALRFNAPMSIFLLRALQKEGTWKAQTQGSSCYYFSLFPKSFGTWREGSTMFLVRDNSFLNYSDDDRNSFMSYLLSDPAKIRLKVGGNGDS